MAATKIILKRSSILGKRPNTSNLEAGELAVNTNAEEPGLFFEVTDGKVVKVGPTAYLPTPPTTPPARGEFWVDSDTKALSVGTNTNEWQRVSAPFLGGTGGFTVFVAPEYNNSSDSLSNDGQAVPYKTINRAVIEVTKQIIKDTLNGSDLGNSRYTIMLAPSRHCVVNSAGVSVANFTVNFDSGTTLTQAALAQFNPIEGGLVLPRGVSIIGLDLKKCEVHPIYVPTYTHPLFPANYQQQTLKKNGFDGPIFTNQPRTNIFRWSGNTYLSNFTALDKLSERSVYKITSQPDTNYAIFECIRPHGLNYNDFVRIGYLNTADQAGAVFSSGAYYVSPVDSYTFLVSPISWTSVSPVPVPVLATSLPAAFLASDSAKTAKFLVSSIYPYYSPTDLTSFEYSNYSHHRLSVIGNASIDELNEFYTKVQLAFPVEFSGRVDTRLASVPEYEIVAPTTLNYPNNTVSNSVDNTSPYENMVNHRTSYGMANGDYDGDIVSGFKSVIINSSTAVMLQKDPAPYEIYNRVGSIQAWTPLTQAALTQLRVTDPTIEITNVPTAYQLELLNQQHIPNIRYYYETLKVIDPVSTLEKSTGIADPDKDFRHFGFRISGANAYMQAQSTYTIGAAIGVWATNGGLASLTNATTNFGSVAFQSEGFAGIGTLGGANEVNRGFTHEGITRPLGLIERQVISDNQKRLLYLGSRVVGVGLDPNDRSVQLVYLESPFVPASILPFSLRPNSAVFISDDTCTYRGYFVADGSPTVVTSAVPAGDNIYSAGGAILRIRASDSTIPNGAENRLSIPYIRRFIDPRTAQDKSYGFYIRNTNPTSQAPQLGSVLRLNQTGQQLSSSIKRNYQFDPGKFGGFGQIFTVDSVLTLEQSSSGNFNNKISDVSQSAFYTVYASLTDSAGGWLQSIYVEPFGLLPYNCASGSYFTYADRNWYSAENNLWDSVYYKTDFNVNNGPTKVSPDDPNSPFVQSSVLQRQELIQDSWQGYVPDPVYNYYNGVGVPDEYKVPDSYKSSDPVTYFRGAVIPFAEYGGQFQVDLDDGTDGMGIIFTRLPLSALSTVTVAPSVTVTPVVSMTTPFATNPTFAIPGVMQLDLLSVNNVVNPRSGFSVLQISNPTINVIEYVRVIGINSNHVTVQRNCYSTFYNPQAPNQGWINISNAALPAVWPKGSVVTPCVSTGFPEPSVYDPNWTVSKITMFRYYQLMGYSVSQMLPILIPQYSGARVFLNTKLPYSPINGYANISAAWPIEFNNPSSVIANTHTWQYVGYFDYSRGLPKYQTNEISRKLQYDYLSTTSFGGRLTVVGSVDNGNIVFLGPVKEALTGNFYTNNTPLLNFADRVTYTSPAPVEFPSSVLVYSADDISGSFNGVQTSFNLTHGGYPIPASQISEYGVFVFIGGVIQIPGSAYNITTTNLGVLNSVITFSEPPRQGSSCDIRIVSTDDNEQTVEVVNFSLTPAFDGILSTFRVSPSYPELTNLNSFVFLGGVEQNPSGLLQASPAYTVTTDSNGTLISFIGIPEAGTTLSFRGILSGAKYRGSNISSVFVKSIDDISLAFNGSRSTFPLLIDGLPLDPALVDAENIFVSLGGVMQCPQASTGDPLAGTAYSVGIDSTTKVLSITFGVAPLSGLTCNIRVVTSTEFISCPLPLSFTNPNLEVGPGISVNDQNQIVKIDPGIIG